MGVVLVFIVILLVLAAVFGVLATVVKAALILTLSALLTVALLGAFTYYWVRHRVRQYQRDVRRAYGGGRGGALPPGF